MLCFSATSDELVDVLIDARCSFLDLAGRFHLVRKDFVDGRSVQVSEFCRILLDGPFDRGQYAEIDLRAGRVPVADGVLANPIELLHWLVTQNAAVDFHPSVNAYIFSSDPDDILPFLPFHAAAGRGGDEVATVLALRLSISPAKGEAPSTPSVVIGDWELSQASGAA